MINLKIDPEFQSQIPPLTDDEFKQLEENILKEGKLLSPLIVWNNTLVDGHNRYEIVQEHPEISFSTMPLPFESREEVLAWICKNQLGRRNLTPEQKYYLMGKQYEAEKAAHGGDRKSSDAKSSSQSANLINNTKTCDRIAEENGVSKDTVIRASRFTKGVEIAESLIPGMREKILNKQVKVSKSDMHRLARADYHDRAQTLQDILHCNQSRNGLTLSTFRDSTLKNMPAGQWRCIIGQTDTLLSVSSRTAGAPRCFSLKSRAISTPPQCKRGCMRAMTYRQADTPLPSKSERSERRRQ